MADTDFLFVNGHTVNRDNTESKESVIGIRRGDSLFGTSDNEHIHAAVSRFKIMCDLPLFSVADNEGKWQIGIQSTVPGSPITMVPITFGADEYLYDYEDIPEYVNPVVDGIASGLSIVPTDVPVFSFDPENNRFSWTTTTTFRTNWNIIVSSMFRVMTHSFRYKPTGEGNYRLVIRDGVDIYQQSNQTIEIMSPVEKIVLKTTLPIIREEVPAPGAENADNPTRQTESFMIDYYYNQINSQTITLVQQSVGDNSVYRWYTLISSRDISTFEFEFLWNDHYGISHKLPIIPHGYADIKTVFKRFAKS